MPIRTSTLSLKSKYNNYTIINCTIDETCINDRIQRDSNTQYQVVIKTNQGPTYVQTELTFQAAWMENLC